MTVSNGYTFGTKAYSHGAVYAYSGLNTYAGYYSPKYCSGDVLIYKYSPAPPTQAPSFRPTPVPISNPTMHPTEAPIANPSAFPIAHPTLAPTLEPTDAPTLEPVATPTMAPTEEPVASPTEAPTEAPVADPTLEPTMAPSAASTESPTVEPSVKVTEAATEEPSVIQLENSHFCSFQFTKGASSEAVPTGCARFSNDDIGFLEDGSKTAAAFICAKLGEPMKVKVSDLTQFNLQNRVSMIVPGKQTTVTLYDEDNFEGHTKTFTAGYHPALVNVVYPNSENKVVNDNVASLIIKGAVKSFQLPEDVCNDGAIEDTPAPSDAPTEAPEPVEV